MWYEFLLEWAFKQVAYEVAKILVEKYGWHFAVTFAHRHGVDIQDKSKESILQLAEDEFNGAITVRAVKFTANTFAQVAQEKQQVGDLRAAVVRTALQNSGVNLKPIPPIRPIQFAASEQTQRTVQAIQPHGKIYVASYRRLDGTKVRGHYQNMNVAKVAPFTPRKHRAIFQEASTRTVSY